MARLGEHRPALTIDRFALYRAADEGAAAASLCETLVDSEAFELQCIRRCAKTSLLYTTTGASYIWNPPFTSLSSKLPIPIPNDVWGNVNKSLSQNICRPQNCSNATTAPDSVDRQVFSCRPSVYSERLHSVTKSRLCENSVVLIFLAVHAKHGWMFEWQPFR